MKSHVIRRQVHQLLGPEFRQLLQEFQRQVQALERLAPALQQQVQVQVQEFRQLLQVLQQQVLLLLFSLRLFWQALFSQQPFWQEQECRHLQHLLFSLRLFWVQLFWQAFLLQVEHHVSTRP